MANYVLLGLEGESRMLIVDCEAMTVGEVDPATAGAMIPGETDSLQRVNEARAEGQTIVKGVNMAIATAQQPPTASFPFASSFPFTEPA